MSAVADVGGNPNEIGKAPRIQISAKLVERHNARQAAARENKSLNTAFREWLARYAGSENTDERYERLMRLLDHARPGRKFSRQEMNER